MKGNVSVVYLISVCCGQSFFLHVTLWFYARHVSEFYVHWFYMVALFAILQIGICYSSCSGEAEVNCKYKNWKFMFFIVKSWVVQDVDLQKEMKFNFDDLLFWSINSLWIQLGLFVYYCICYTSCSLFVCYFPHWNQQFCTLCPVLALITQTC